MKVLSLEMDINKDGNIFLFQNLYSGDGGSNGHYMEDNTIIITPEMIDSVCDELKKLKAEL